MSFTGDTVRFVFQIIGQILFLYEIAIIIVIALSWVNPDPYNPIVRALHSITDPVMDRVRGLIPPIGMLDLTPMVIILLIEFIRSIALPHLANALIAR